MWDWITQGRALMGKVDGQLAQVYILLLLSGKEGTALTQVLLHVYTVCCGGKNDIIIFFFFFFFFFFLFNDNVLVVCFFFFFFFFCFFFFFFFFGGGGGGGGVLSMVEEYLQVFVSWSRSKRVSFAT